MFIKKVRIKRAGRTYTYLRILESYRQQGRVRQRVLAHLGNLESIKPKQLAQLSGQLAELGGIPPAAPAQLDHRRVFIYGPVLAIRTFWRQLGLEEFLGRQSASRKWEFELSRCVWLMVLSRLIRPSSKLQLTEWHQQLWHRSCLAEGYPQYQHYLRSLDLLAQLKGPLQRHLFGRLTDLFSLKLRLVFFDLTSSYFVGSHCGLSRHGYSRDHRPDKKQIVVGLLMTEEGLPIGHFVFRGHRADKQTLKRVVRCLRREFQVQQCVFVGDRGLISQVNLDMLIEEGFGYLMALRKRMLSEVKELWGRLPDAWQPAGPHLQIKEHFQEDVRYLVCRNPQKQEDDRRFREGLLHKSIEQLQKIAAGSAAASRKLTRAAEVLSKTKAKKFFDITLDAKNNFSWSLREEVVTAEAQLDGIYVLKTDQLDWPAAQVVEYYKDLAEVEDGFRQLKSFVELRPIRHYAPRRVLGHVSVCVLALLLERMMDLALSRAQLTYRVGMNGPLPKGAHRPDHPVNRSLKAAVALERLDSIKMIESELGPVTVYRAVRTSDAQERILQALGVRSLPLSFQPD